MMVPLPTLLLQRMIQRPGIPKRKVVKGKSTVGRFRPGPSVRASASVCPYRCPRSPCPGRPSLVSSTRSEHSHRPPVQQPTWVKSAWSGCLEEGLKNEAGADRRPTPRSLSARQQGQLLLGRSPSVSSLLLMRETLADLRVLLVVELVLTLRLSYSSSSQPAVVPSALDLAPDPASRPPSHDLPPALQRQPARRDVRQAFIPLVG